MFCKHQWELINQFTVSSQLEIMVSCGKPPDTWQPSSCVRTHVTDYTCTKCGKLKRFRERSE